MKKLRHSHKCKNTQPGASSRDHFYPLVGGHQQPLKGSRFHHPKKGTIAELPGGDSLFSCLLAKVHSICRHFPAKNAGPRGQTTSDIFSTARCDSTARRRTLGWWDKGLMVLVHSIKLKLLLLMEEIPNNHLGYINPCK